MSEPISVPSMGIEPTGGYEPPEGPAKAQASGTSVRTAARIGKKFSFRMAAQILSAMINVGAMVLLGN